MLPMACSTTPSAPHFGHLFVGRVGAGTWMGMASQSTPPAHRVVTDARRGRSGARAELERHGAGGTRGGPDCV
jgi:hypothetical protein